MRRRVPQCSDDGVPMNLKLDKRFAKQPQQALAFRRIVAVCLKRGNALFLLGDPSLGIGDVPVGLSEVFDLRHWSDNVTRLPLPQ